MRTLIRESTVITILILIGGLIDTPISLAQAQSAPLSTTVDSGATQLDAVIVTAQKREENLQEVPISVSTITSSTINNLPAPTLASLQGMLPNVQIGAVSNSPNSAVFNIRGMGVIDADPFVGTTVTVVQDGVIQGTNTNALLNLFDVDRIEVLRGPQGTLFGANTTGGVINIITKQPTGEYGARFQLDYGNYNQLDLNASINFPIIKDVLAGKISVSQDGRNGFYTNLVTGQPFGGIDETDLRAYLRFTPIDGLESTLIFEYDRARNGSPVVVSEAVPGDLLYVAPGFPGLNHFVSSDNDPDLSNNNTYSGTLTTNWNSAIGKLTSITGYKSYDLIEYTDQDGTPLFLADTYRTTTHWQYSEELRLSTQPVQSVEVLYGAFYMKQNYKLLQIFREQGFVAGLSNNLTEDEDQYSAAAFAQAYWNATSKLRFQAGVRVTRDQAEMLAANRNYLNPNGPALFFGGNLLPGAFSVDGSRVWDNVGGKAGVQYNFQDDAMVYGTATHGFKSGGFNGRVGVPGDIGPYGPEKVNTYEVGLKSEWLNHRLRFNIDEFYNDYKDIQERLAYYIGCCQNSTKIFNAARAKTYGTETEVQALLFEGFTYNLSAAYLHAAYTQFIQPIGGVNVDFAGKPLENSPHVTASTGFNYEFKVGSGIATWNTQASYVDSRYTNLTELPLEHMKPYTLVNAHLDWKPNGSKWSVGAYCSNCFNYGYIPYAEDNVGLWTIASFGPPRQYGVTFRYDFD